MTNKRSSLLYDFYQELSGRFTSMDSLLRRAMPLVCQYMSADRVFFFDWKRDEAIISLKMMCDGKASFYSQEDIFFDNDSPEIIKFLQDGIMDSPSLDYPAVYVLLKWIRPAETISSVENRDEDNTRYAVLKVERFNKDKFMTHTDKEILLSLAHELSAKINLTEADHYNISRLYRAHALSELTKVFAKSIRLGDSIIEILKNIQKSFRFDRTSLYLSDTKTDNLTEAYTADLSGEVKKIDISENIYKNFTNNCEDGTNICPVAAKSDIVLSLPLVFQNKLLGWLVFDNILSRIAIPQEDITSLRQFSSQVALAIDNARLFEKVQELSNYDELTGLALRRFFNESLAQEIYRSKRFNLTVSIILLDLDYFKGINDTYGHIMGDEALKAVAHVIQSSLRQTDLPCRYGGDEIVIMLPRTTAEEAKNIAARLSARVRAIKLPERLTRGEDIKLSISQGIACFPYDTDDEKDLMLKADKALYHVKETGRGVWAAYSDLKEDKDA